MPRKISMTIEWVEGEELNEPGVVRGTLCASGMLPTIPSFEIQCSTSAGVKAPGENPLHEKRQAFMGTMGTLLRMSAENHANLTQAMQLLPEARALLLALGEKPHG
jgi:hypothetical protein